MAFRPRLETALIYLICSRFRMGGIFLRIWRIPTVRKLINFPRHFHFMLTSFRETNLEDREEIDRVANSLRRDGFAITHIGRLSGMPGIQELQEEYDLLLERERQKPHSRKSKVYIERLVDDDYDFRNNGESPFSKFVRNSSLNTIASIYLRLTPKKTSFKVWRSHFTGEANRTASQNWHRDYNEFQMIRCFLYLNNVTLQGGAGEYIVGSHYLGDSYNLLEYSEESGTYATDKEISDNFDASRVIAAEGGEGTVVLIDTAGLHRGGYHSVPSERRVALLTFSTAADIMPTRIPI